MLFSQTLCTEVSLLFPTVSKISFFHHNNVELLFLLYCYLLDLSDAENHIELGSSRPKTAL